MSNCTKPPRGLMPKEIYERECNEKRIVDILEAMARYSEAGKVIPVKWIEELGNRVWRI